MGRITNKIYRDRIRSIQLGRNLQKHFKQPILDALVNGGIKNLVPQIVSEKKIRDDIALKSLEYALYGNQEGPDHMRYKGLIEY